MATKASSIYRPGVWNGYNVGKHHSASSGPVTPVGQRDPTHIYRPGFWDSYGLHGQGTGTGGSGGGGRGKKKAKGKRVHYSRHPIRSAALHDVWAHRGMAGGQG